MNWMQATILSMAFGGLEQYTGRNMLEAHKHMKITEAHFNGVCGHLVSTLQDFKVPQNLIVYYRTHNQSRHRQHQVDNWDAVVVRFLRLSSTL